MPLIKRAHNSTAIPGTSVLDLGDLHRQAEEIIERAREQARQIVVDAERQAADLIESSDAKGHTQGLERGLIEGREQGAAEARVATIEQLTREISQLQQQWTTALESWEHDREEMFVRAGDDVLRFALKLAEMIVGRVAATDSQVVSRQVAESLALVSRPSAVTVLVNPEDAPLIEEVLPSLVEKVDGCEHAAIREDPAITRGGCIIRTGAGSVDARIEEQLARVADSLLGTPGSEAAPGMAPADGMEGTPRGGIEGLTPEGAS